VAEHLSITGKNLPERRYEDNCKPVEKVKASQQGQTKQPEPEQQVHLTSFLFA
jgi:hypothetical protein